MTAPTVSRTLDGAEIDVPADDIPVSIRNVLAEQYSSKRVARIPKPDMPYITALRDKGMVDLATTRENIQNIRRNRYGRTETPAGLLLTLKNIRRIFTGLSNNEIGRVASTLTRNVPEIMINADDDDQQKFFNAFLAYQEQRIMGGLIYPTVDCMAECGWAFWEWYVDPEVEDLEIERRPDESAKEYKTRVTPLLRKAGPILRIRQLDPEACIWDPLAEDMRYFLIAERKNGPVLRRELAMLERDPKDADDPRLPGEHDRGAPYQGGYAAINGTMEFETIRYWDEKWYCYIVGDEVVECVEHGFATIPISAFPGKVTGTSNPSDRAQGIVHTLWRNEEMQDTLLTVDVDTTLTYGGPKVVVTADKDVLAMPPGTDGAPPTVDLTNPKETPYLPPGYKIADAYAGYQLNEGLPVRNNLGMYWNRATMNEVSSGAAPGADVAGYTVNALQTASLTNYNPFLTNLQNGIAKGVDCIARPFFKRLGIPVSIASPNRSEAWLTLRPNKIDDTPVSCVVSPLADIQKMQITQLLAQLKSTGVISGYTAAEASPMVPDPEMEQKRKDLEVLHAALTPRAIEDLMVQLYGAPVQAAVPGAAPPTNYGDGQQGNVPAQPQPPTVPGDTTPGPEPVEASTMRAGLPRQMGQ